MTGVSARRHDLSAVEARVRDSRSGFRWSPAAQAGDHYLDVSKRLFERFPCGVKSAGAHLQFRYQQRGRQMIRALGHRARQQA